MFRAFASAVSASVVLAYRDDDIYKIISDAFALLVLPEELTH